MTYRVIAQHILTGEILNWNLRMQDISVQYTLSGPNVLSGTISPENLNLNVAAYDSWATWLHLELDGRIMCSGILEPTSLDGPSIKVECEGPTGYAHGIPFLGEISEIGIDPTDVVRRLWDHVQSYPTGKIGLNVDQTTKTPKDRWLGTPAPAATEDNPNPEASPYQLDWWDPKDIGDEINNVAKDAPFDYIERDVWNDDKTNVLHYMDFGYPRLGRFRDDLRFAEGENITASVPLEEISDQYASHVIVLGAGEGSARIRGEHSGSVGDRLRRVVTVTDTSITTVDRANQVAKDEWNRRQARYSFDKITIDGSHRNAKIGTFSCGDDIAVQGKFAWVGRVTINHRITAYTWTPSTRLVDLTLSPSASFNYGPPTTGT